MGKLKLKREHSKLLKLGFKSIVSHKLFTILIAILIFISGATYTLLTSANDSFQASYNNVDDNGKLHDYVIKENFKDPTGSKSIEIYDPTTNTNVIYNDANIERIATQHKDTSGVYHIKYVATHPTGDYASQKDVTSNVSIKDDGDATFTKELLEFKKEYENLSSNMDYKAEETISENLIKNLKNKYSNDIWFNENKSISIESDKKAFNVVKYNSNTDINKMFIYDGTSKITNELTDSEMNAEILNKIDDTGNGRVDYTIDDTKGFRILAKTNTGGGTISLTDPSSYQAIISPGYANRNNKLSLSPQKFIEIWESNPNIMDLLVNDKDLANKYNNNLVWVDKTPYFIVGIGTTPDYLYPIVDQSHPVIDVQNQATIFVNNRGYQRIRDAFRTNPTENYISLKFKPGVTEGQKTTILKSLNQDILAKSNPLPGIPFITSAFEKNDQMLLTQERVMFLKDLEKTISTISYVTTTLLAIFVAAIVILVFRMIVSMDRKILATQMALGYSKVKIALVKSMGALLIVGIPVVLGYIIGYFMQFWFIGKFDNYWTIPTWGTTFSLTPFLVTFIIPIIAIFGLIFIITLITMHRPLPELLKGADAPGATFMSKTVSKIKIVGVKGRYAVSLMAKNSFKLFLVSIASIVSLTSLVVGISSIGQADRAYVATTNMSNYEFAINLYSPTAQGGEYSTIYDTDLNKIPHNMNTRSGNPISNTPEWHVPSINDANMGLASNAELPANIVDASIYLKNKIQIKHLLDKKVGGLNPWNIAKGLMPDNQKNKAEQNDVDINKLQGATPWDKVSKALSQTGDDKIIPYMITYGLVIENHGDEKYTYMQSKFLGSDFKIIGVNSNTKMVNINSQLNNINNYLGNNTPILINKYIQEKYHLKLGSVFSMDIYNGYHRMENGNNKISKSAEVVGIVDGYDDKGIYTTRKVANKILSMPADGFNGIFTKNKNSELLSTLPLYSPSGLWLGTDTIVGAWEHVLSEMLKNTNIWSTSNSANIASNVDEFINKFSRTPFVGATSTVQWNEISKFAFQNISHLSSFLISMVEAIAITLSIIFTIIIASLLLISNRKKIASLWTMGYRKSEVARIFLSTYILPTIIAIAISIPIAFAVLTGMKTFIMGFGSILIPFAITWYAPLIAIFVISSIFIIATFLTINTQKQQKALEAFKGD